MSPRIWREMSALKTGRPVSKTFPEESAGMAPRKAVMKASSAALSASGDEGVMTRKAGAGWSGGSIVAGRRPSGSSCKLTMAKGSMAPASCAGRLCRLCATAAGASEALTPSRTDESAWSRSQAARVPDWVSNCSAGVVMEATEGRAVKAARVAASKRVRSSSGRRGSATAKTSFSPAAKRVKAARPRTLGSSGGRAGSSSVSKRMVRAAQRPAPATATRKSVPGRERKRAMERVGRRETGLGNWREWRRRRPGQRSEGIGGAMLRRRCRRQTVSKRRRRRRSARPGSVCPPTRRATLRGSCRTGCGLMKTSKPARS